MTATAQAPPSDPSLDRTGRTADSPWKMGWAAWKAVLVRVWNASWTDNIGLIAAGVGFYTFLAIVPLLGIFALTYGLFADVSTVVGHVEGMLRFLPPDVALLIGNLLLDAVQSSADSKGLGVLLALGVALYAGGNGAGAIMTALNVAYREKERRSLTRFYLIAFAITLAAVVLMLAALAAGAAVRSLETLLPTASPAALFAGKLLAHVALLLAAAAVAATLYRYGPSREDARWTWLTPGSLFTAIVWLALTIGFGFYVTRLTDYSATYGSIAAVIMLITWLYLSAYVFLFGAELNAELEHQTARDSTTGPEEPLGRRGAWAADHVASGKEDKAEDAPSLAEAGPAKPGSGEADPAPGRG